VRSVLGAKLRGAAPHVPPRRSAATRSVISCVLPHASAPLASRRASPARMPRRHASSDLVPPPPPGGYVPRSFRAVSATPAPQRFSAFADYVGAAQDEERE